MKRHTMVQHSPTETRKTRHPRKENVTAENSIGKLYQWFKKNLIRSIYCTKNTGNVLILLFAPGAACVSDQMGEKQIPPGGDGQS